MYNLAYDKAKEMLQKNCPVLEQIVEQLLMFENLTGHVSSYFSYLHLNSRLLLERERSSLIMCMDGIFIMRLLVEVCACVFGYVFANMSHLHSFLCVPVHVYICAHMWVVCFLVPFMDFLL